VFEAAPAIITSGTPILPYPSSRHTVNKAIIPATPTADPRATPTETYATGPPVAEGSRIAHRFAPKNHRH